MKRQIWIAIVIFALGMPSCNLPGDQPTETSLASPSPTLVIPITSASTSTLVPINTLLAIDTPTVIPTSTPNLLLASPKDQPVNCRFGPGTQYAIAGALNPGRQAEIIGKNEDSSWWYVRNPSDPSTLCWLAASVTATVGNVDALPVVEPPEIMVTSVNVSVDPPGMNVACDAFPQTVIISAFITTNGPSIVIWRWESSTGKTSAENNLLFEEGGTKTVQDYYQVDSANDYSIQVRTIVPNVVIGQANFKVICTP
ncbi:MAG TPA: SH3 domain-containing protein [Anaerolineales bacterium]|nr:SH3 domain-containing protein [Anaerolineales bacterium]